MTMYLKGMHILTGNGDVRHRECTLSPGMGTCLTRMHILTGNGNVTHRECTSLLGMYILTRNAHSLYRVFLNKINVLPTLRLKPECCQNYSHGNWFMIGSTRYQGWAFHLRFFIKQVPYLAIK